MNTPSDRLRHARLTAGFERAVDAASHFGWQGSTYYGHENGSRGISAKVAAVYASAFDVTPDWLLYGFGQPQSNRSASLDSGLSNGFSNPAPTLPQVDRLLSISTMQEVTLESSVDRKPTQSGTYVALRAEYLQRFSMIADNLRTIVVEGDAMAPTLADGDLVIIDLGRPGGVWEGIFWVTDPANNTLLRRLGPALKANTVCMIADNGCYPSREVNLSDIVVHGRAVWVGKRI
jgi:phage repressor protein C with HTH and peptisase S24 domain